MTNIDLHPQIAEELRAAIDRATASGELMVAAQIDAKSRARCVARRFGNGLLARIVLRPATWKCSFRLSKEDFENLRSQIVTFNPSLKWACGRA
jgi:hypothetical protein